MIDAAVPSKVYSSLDDAIADVFDGATIMFGGFGSVGAPYHLIEALLRKGTKDITAIANDCLEWTGLPSLDRLVDAGQMRKVICSFPVYGSPQRVNAFERRYLEGKVELELAPQGTLAERIRAGGAGLGPFYVPTGVGTEIAKGKETRIFNGREYLLETPLRADYAFIRAYKADRLGNLIYRKSARNFNPVMATAADITIAEVEELAAPGDIDPETVATPCIYVDRVVVVREQ